MKKFGRTVTMRKVIMSQVLFFVLCVFVVCAKIRSSAGSCS
jgi:hypothetical protein